MSEYERDLSFVGRAWQKACRLTMRGWSSARAPKIMKIELAAAVAVLLDRARAARKTHTTTT